MSTMDLDCDHGGTVLSCPVCLREAEEERVLEYRWPEDAWDDATVAEPWIPAGMLEARFQSTCPECGSRIEVGETIFMRGGMAVCEVCA